jgi:hypothetical protein
VRAVDRSATRRGGRREDQVVLGTLKTEPRVMLPIPTIPQDRPLPLAISEVVMYISAMTMVEHTLSHMLRNSGDVIAEAEHQDVVLRRRDGADLFLGLRSRQEMVRSALGVLARLLVTASLDPSIRERVASALTASLPWTSFLPSGDRAEFFEALTTKAAACVELGNFEPLARLIEGWRATAEVYGVPELRAKLTEVERTGPPVPIRRPEAG